MVIKIIQLKMLFLLLFIWSTNLSGHNASENKNIPQKNTQRLNEEIKRSQSVEQPVNQPPGRAVYAKYCLTCHQSNGSGVPGMNPPLGPGSWVGKDAKDLINLLLNGQTGEIEVNGEFYKNYMPPQSKLTDDEIAEVLTYIRSNFRNNYKSVTPEMVKTVRGIHLK